MSDDKKLETFGNLADHLVNMTKIDPPTDEEWEALVDWVRANKDDIPVPAKWGLLSLVNLENRRRLK